MNNEEVIIEEINVLQTRVRELHEDYEILYKISQEQKERIQDLSVEIHNTNKVMTVRIYSAIVIAICLLLLLSYLFVFGS